MKPYNDDNFYVKTIRSPRDFLAIADQWDSALLEYEQASLHLSSFYINAIWFADNGTYNPHVIIIYNGSKIAAMAVLDKSIYKYALPISAAIPLNQKRYGRADVIILENDAAPVMVRAVRKMNVDIWHLDRFPSNSSFIEYCQSNLPAKHYYHYEDNELAIINSRQSWTEYLAAKSKNFRRSYKRIFDASSSLHIQLYHSSGIDIEGVIAEISTINGQSWKNDTGSDFSKDPKKMQFFRKLLRDSANQNNLVVGVLYDQKKPVAYTFGIIYDTILYAIETGYIDEYSDHNAGITSYIAIMKYAHDNPNISACDMDTIRGNDYKRRWATHIDTQKSAFIILGGWGGYFIRTSRLLSYIKKYLIQKLGW